MYPTTVSHLAQHKKEEKERLARVGDWSEHVSSSGKKYYYNCRTEVSQWEKPPEWLEWERTRAKETSNRSHDKSSTRQDKHSNLGESYREGRDIRDSERERNDRDRREVYRGDDMYDRRDTRKYGQDVGAADMDISSGDSTPTSEHLHARGTTTENSHDVSGATVSLATTSGATVTSTHSGTTTTHLQSGLRPKLGLLPGSLPSSLPLLSSNAVASTSGNNTTTTTSLASSLPALGGSTSMAVPQLLNLHPRLMTLPNSMNKSGIDMDMKSVNCNNSHTHDGEGMLVKSQLEPLTISASSNNIGGGPPTPTHSENQDCIDIRKVGSPTSSINSLQSLTQTAGGSLAGLRPLVPALTPSLANYYKESLITHVQNWPAEALEKPAQRLSEEAHSVGSLVMTRVSAELKMARSLVRLAEIQATLHEQRPSQVPSTKISNVICVSL
ncbi:WW domain-containing adapter protein with coiled-coil [Chionoecetes opilio]|uniref:WW domain-containing adapter protein with coiled-coil n=1 Tax=Chionoecetes opilio TaxID=41210 RepID=A0A8J4XWR3_CHIOP|nr:WW domain-containing adapter protein with coiled-coil [Chionoecetes opilio]